MTDKENDMIAEKERITSKSDGDCDVDADGETDKVTRNVQPAVKPSTTLVNKGEGKSTDEGAGGLASGTAKENGASKANGTANGNDKSGASKSERKDGEDGGSGEGSGGDAGDEKKSESIEKNKKDNAIAKSGSDSSKQADKKEDEMTADGLAEDEDVTMKERQERQESEKNGAKTSEENTDKAVNEEENDEDPFAGLDEVATMDLYNISNYTFGKKEEKSGCKALGDMSERSISSALRKEYGQRGMRRSVRAVLLVHEHNFAHILLLQRNDGKGEFVLPGGKLRPGENFEEGLLRKLSSKLCPVDSVADAEMDDDPPVLEVGDKLGKWYAVDYSRKYFPYVPAHVSKPREEVHVYTISLPCNFMFAVPNNLQLVAVPLCDVHNNVGMYGSMISAVPALLSRFHINLC